MRTSAFGSHKFDSNLQETSGWKYQYYVLKIIKNIIDYTVSKQ